MTQGSELKDSEFAASNSECKSIDLFVRLSRIFPSFDVFVLLCYLSCVIYESSILNSAYTMASARPSLRLRDQFSKNTS